MKIQVSCYHFTNTHIELYTPVYKAKYWKKNNVMFSSVVILGMMIGFLKIIYNVTRIFIIFWSKIIMILLKIIYSVTRIFVITWSTMIMTLQIIYNVCKDICHHLTHNDSSQN